MSQVQESQKQADLAIEEADGACEGLKQKHLTFGYGWARKKVNLSVSIASCNQKCVFVGFESDGEKANKCACVLEEQRFEPDHSITIIVVDKGEQTDTYLGSLFVRRNLNKPTVIVSRFDGQVRIH